MVAKAPRDSQNHKGRAFVHFESLDRADKAIADLHKVRCLDQNSEPLEVEYARGWTARLGLPDEAGRPGFENKLFVGNLPQGINDAGVAALFQSCLTLKEARVLRNGKGSAAAFVKLGSKEEALRAIEDFRNTPINLGAGRAVEVRYANSRRPQSTSDGKAPRMHHTGPPQISSTWLAPSLVIDLSSQLSSMPPLAVRASALALDSWTEIRNPLGKVWFDAETGQYSIVPQSFEFGGLPPLQGLNLEGTVRPSVQRTEKESRVIMVSQFPKDWDEERLSKHFRQMGKIEEVVILRPCGDVERGTGLVRFSTPISAYNAGVTMDGQTIGDRQLRVRAVPEEVMERFQLLEDL